MVWYFRHYGRLTAKSENYKKKCTKIKNFKEPGRQRNSNLFFSLRTCCDLKKKVQSPLFSLVGGSCPDSFLIFTAPASQQSTSHCPVQGPICICIYVYKWPYEKNAVLLGNWESFWLQFVELRPMNNPSTLLGWKDRVRTFELDKVSLSWLGACWAVLSIAESARRWEFMVPPSSAEELCAVRVQLFGAESATELRVQGLNWKETEH